MTDSAANNRLNSESRPTSWLVSYTMDPSFFTLGADEQYRLETADVTHAVALALEREWKAGYITTDFKTGFIVLQLGNQTNQADADKVLQGYPMYKYFKNITYSRVFTATQAGFDWKTIWGGFKEFLKDRF